MRFNSGAGPLFELLIALLALSNVVAAASAIWAGEGNR